MASKSTWPRPGERKSQPRRGSPKFRCEPRMPALAVEGARGVLDVHVIDAVGEGPDELDRVDELPEQVAGVEVEAELGPVVEGLQGRLGRVDVEGDLGRDGPPGRT